MNPAATQSPQSQAIYVANKLLSMAAQVMDLHNDIRELDLQWTDDNVANTLSNLHTVPVNLDGSLGTVNDGIIDPTHPINPTVYPTLSRPVSATQLGQVKTILDGLFAYIEGQAVATQVGAHAILNAVLNG